MTTQPNFPLFLEWDITDITVGDLIFQVGENFDIDVTFDGTGLFWSGMEGLGLAYDCNIYAEGLGAGAPELDLGTVNDNLSAAGGPYTANLNTNIGTAGAYKLAATVTFPDFPGVAGFIEGPIIQIFS